MAADAVSPPQVLPPGGLFDVVVCDGAPNVGGAWSSEAYSQAALVLEACKLATEFLAPKGLFLTKVFRSAEYHALLYAFGQLFERVESTKPVASRSTSAEIYVACHGYRAPGRLDRRLLDPAHVFAPTEDGGGGGGGAGTSPLPSPSPTIRTEQLSSGPSVMTAWKGEGEGVATGGSTSKA